MQAQASQLKTIAGYFGIELLLGILPQTVFEERRRPDDQAGQDEKAARAPQ
jgi:hypothetical protein